MNLEWYKVFYAAAQTGSLSKAAEALYITQPAVTHSIKQLESQLGGQLFFRTSKGVQLTDEGQVLFKYIEQAFNFITTGERKLAELHELMTGEIKIGAGDTLCRHYLLPYLQSFHSAYPDIKIQVTNRTSPETIQLLKEGKIDLGIINLPATDARLKVVESASLQDCFVAGLRYKQLNGKPLTLGELSGYPLILLEQGSNTRAYIDGYAAEQGVSLKPEIELGSNDLLVEFARTGLGIACVIRNFVQKELNATGSDLFEIQLDRPIPPRKVGIITLKDVPLSSAAKRFIDQILA
ncbi:LysR family transcriptional regulator [Paenibacillus rigui]|uniref:LysR family transcriptional regulator n=1 Tax=Paenibacillus rigui TaxID=554312 RepID=A0A229UHB8_9BACL|nr:LysR family transcriptional regulator [Paenibacillus rigui]OXM82745.1 LysR family transcriptional regulator [Paenibacillus rigui]